MKKVEMMDRNGINLRMSIRVMERTLVVMKKA